MASIRTIQIKAPHAAGRKRVTKSFLLLSFIIASFPDSILLSLEFGAGRMIRAVDQRVAIQAPAGVPLRRRALVGPRYTATAGGHVPVRQVRAAVEVLAVVAAVAALTEHRRPHLQERR